jgi:hypothetical protein
VTAQSALQRRLTKSDRLFVIQLYRGSSSVLFDIDVPAAMRPVFNVVWNAFGFAQCDVYDDQGKVLDD